MVVYDGKWDIFSREQNFPIDDDVLSFKLNNVIYNYS